MKTDRQTSSEAFLAIRQCLFIAHHLPGRIRFRFDPALRELISGDDVLAFKDVWARIPGVKDLRINNAAASVVIEYDADEIEPGLWERLLHGTKKELEDLVEHLSGQIVEPG